MEDRFAFHEVFVEGPIVTHEAAVRYSEGDAWFDVPNDGHWHTIRVMFDTVTLGYITWVDGFIAERNDVVSDLGTWTKKSVRELPIDQVMDVFFC